MHQLVQLSGRNVEKVDRVLDEDDREDFARLEYVRDQLQAKALEEGRTLSQRRFAVRPKRD